MKKILYTSLALLVLTKSTFAQENYTGIPDEKLRNGDIHVEDIPGIIKSVIDFGMGIAGTIAVLFVIIGAYKILFGSLSQDKTKGKDTIFMALGGFVIASLAWFIIRIIIDNL